jgi:methionyl aminopeptidase
VLAEGDIVSLDCGVKYEGMYTDSATTVPVGEISAADQRLLDVTQEALRVGIAAAVVGNHVGDIGHAVRRWSSGRGTASCASWSGTASGTARTRTRRCPTTASRSAGRSCCPGLTIAIEPMVNAGLPGTRTLADKWTVVTIDGKRSAHFEHTVAVTESGPRILTLPD